MKRLAVCLAAIVATLVSASPVAADYSYCGHGTYWPGELTREVYTGGYWSGGVHYHYVRVERRGGHRGSEWVYAHQHLRACGS